MPPPEGPIPKPDLPNLTERQRLRALQASGRLRPNPALGQNFLVEERLLERIVSAADIQPGDRVLEIGPGIGSLTHFLLETGARISCVELDAALAVLLGERFADMPASRFDLAVGDFLRYNFDPGGGVDPGAFRIVANLPYYLTSEAVARVLTRLPAFRCAVFTIQKEAAERLGRGPGSKSYGPLSCLVRWMGAWRVLFPVPKSAFSPIPDVESVVVRLDPDPARFSDPDRRLAFFAFLQQAFSSRRKTLANSLAASGAHGSRIRVHDLLGPAASAARAEDLSPDILHDLFLRLT